MVLLNTLYVVVDGDSVIYGVSTKPGQFYWYPTQGDAEKDILPSEYRVVRITQTEFERERGW